MEREARKRSVDNLQRLYTVVMSLAITESLRQLLGPGIWPGIPAVVAVVSLLVTIIPFYHGANRYLDATYITGERSSKPDALMLDFVALFLEGIAFFILAVLIRKPLFFYSLLSSLFFFDAMWVGLTKLPTAHGADTGLAYKPWALANGAAGLLMLLSIWSNLFPSETVRAVAACTIAILRTVIDYATVWKFYYPEVSIQPNGAGKKEQ